MQQVTLRKMQPKQTVTDMRLANAVNEALDGRTSLWLAKKLGVDKATVSRLLNGKTRIDLERVQAIEVALKLPAGALLIKAGYVDLGPLQQRLTEQVDELETRIRARAPGTAKSARSTAAPRRRSGEKAR